MGLTLGSLFDGSGAFPLAGIRHNIIPIWACEIEPYPIRVSHKNLPTMKHYGDVRKIKGDEIEPVDIITFGSPCQDISNAGKKRGLKAKRSALFLEAIRIIKEMRNSTNGTYPRYVIWENVYGAFTSNKGEDFRVVLQEITNVIDGSIIMPRYSEWDRAGLIVGNNWSVGWRGLDARGWGVPQRRKRVFVVADYTNAGGVKEILFKSPSMPRYNAKVKTDGEGDTIAT